jgi:hypothetical protein
MRMTAGMGSLIGERGPSVIDGATLAETHFACFHLVSEFRDVEFANGVVLRSVETVLQRARNVGPRLSAVLLERCWRHIRIIGHVGEYAFRNMAVKGDQFIDEALEEIRLLHLLACLNNFMPLQLCEVIAGMDAEALMCEPQLKKIKIS